MTKSTEMKKVFKVFERMEMDISREQKEMLNWMGKATSLFLTNNSLESIGNYIESLSFDEMIEFYVSWYWDCYRYFNSRKKRKGVL